MEYVQFVLDNKDGVMMILASIVAIASVIANWTPSTSDNAYVDKFGKIVHFLALNWSTKTKA